MGGILGVVVIGTLAGPAFPLRFPNRPSPVLRPSSGRSLPLHSLRFLFPGLLFRRPELVFVARHLARAEPDSGWDWRRFRGLQQSRKDGNSKHEQTAQGGKPDRPLPIDPECSDACAHASSRVQKA
jgi:hypothetical protein